MKPTLLVGILLIILGGAAIAYRGVTYTTREKVLEIGPIKATAEREKTVPIPPILGWVALGSGIVLVVFAAKGKS